MEMMQLELTPSERNELYQCELVIEGGLRTFVDVGNALLTIRDKRLYRDEYGTFETYCQERWGFVPSRARQLIAAARIVGNIGTVTNVTPANESQARPLMALAREQQREAWTRAVETAPEGKVTGAHVKRVVEEMQERSRRRVDHVQASDGRMMDVSNIGKKEPETEAGPSFDFEPLPDEEDEPESKYAHEPEPVPEAEEKQPNGMAVHYSSATPEHYTPQVIIDATLACLGEIDLDPCSNSLTDPVVPAKRHFTADDDGLRWQWHGRIYMNPPYGRQIDSWIAKLCEEHEAGRVTEAIALVPARTDTQWWLRLRDYPVCFIQGRLTFGGNTDPAPFPSAVFYLGEEIGNFYRAFYELGDCWQRMMPGISFGE
jgi:hypothetical protein